MFETIPRNDEIFHSLFLGRTPYLKNLYILLYLFKNKYLYLLCCLYKRAIFQKNTIMKKEKTELENLSIEEIYKLFDKGEINAKEFDELRNTLPKFVQEKLFTKLKDKKKKEIIELYKKGGLSISDTIAYKTNILLERNRKNTNIIATLLVIYFILGILYAIFFFDWSI